MATDWRSLIGHQTRDEILAWALGRWVALGGKITNMNIGGVYRTLLELSVEALATLHDRALAVVPQGFLSDAQGAWLGLLLEDLGTALQPAVAARWNLVVSRADPDGGNVSLPADSEYRTRTTALGDVLRFRQVEAVMLLDGEASVQVLVQAVETGARYNVAPDSIVEFVTAIPGVDAVTNPAGGLVREGVDQEQPDDARSRGRLRWPALARGVVRETLEAWAREVPGVVDVSVDDEHPRGQGTVDVIVTGTSGAPSAELIAAVSTLIGARLLQCVNLLVRGPVLLLTAVRLRAVLPLDRGDEANTKAVIAARVESLLATGARSDTPRMRIGQDLFRGRLVALGMAAVPELLDLVVELPGDHVAALAGELVVLDGPVEVLVDRREA